MPPEIVIGVDYGEKRIGFATGDTITRTARPLETVRSSRSGPDWIRIDALIARFNPARVIVGIPYNEAADERLAVKAAQFADALGRRISVPVTLVDERDSSIEAAALLKARRAAGLQRRVVKGDQDGAAAAIILERWLMNGER